VQKNHKDAANRLILKLLVSPRVTPIQSEDYFVEVQEKFWDEWEQFQGRRGDIFGDDEVCWKSDFIDSNETGRWHFRYTYRETEWLGKLACHVTLKIIGIGSAERNWGDVKHLKAGKRIAMTPEA
jgi:hypothetical protein